MIGKSNGSKSQAFSLVRKPVVDDFALARKPGPYDIVIEVEEFDPRIQEQNRCSNVKPGDPTWIEWRRIDNLYEADQHSRVYLFDPIEGKVKFGDGERGIVPLAGSRIRARSYGVHAGKKGNVDAKKITVLRNPAGEVAKIESVTNYEPASGGRDAESDEEVMRRGPRAIKNQGRVVSGEDLAWLAREADQDIANTFTVPTLDERGRMRPGFASVVVIPNSDEDKPTPTPAQLRAVKDHLERYILANIKEADTLDVRVPGYVSASAAIWLVPQKPEETDKVQKAVLERLKIFLHPLKGGPEQADREEPGWQRGRDIFVSELYAQVENVPGVNYVKRITLQGSMLQYELCLDGPYSPEPELDQPAGLPQTTVISEGTQVSTLDERKKLILSEPCRLQTARVDEHRTLAVAVRGFNVDDDVRLLMTDKDHPLTARVCCVEADRTSETTPFEGRFKITVELNREAVELPSAVESADGRVRLPIVEKSDKSPAIAVAGDQAHTGNSDGTGKAPQKQKFTYVYVIEGLAPSDFVSFFVGRRRLDDLWKVQSTELDKKRICVPDGYLVRAGELEVRT